MLWVDSLVLSSVARQVGSKAQKLYDALSLQVTSLAYSAEGALGNVFRIFFWLVAIRLPELGYRGTILPAE